MMSTYVIIICNKPQIQSNFYPMKPKHHKKVKSMFLFCFSKNCNHSTCLSLEHRAEAKSELVSQLEFLPWRTWRCCLHLLHLFIPTGLIWELHEDERSGTLWTVTDCKAMLHLGTDKSLEKTYQQGRGFFSHPNTCTSVTKKAKRFCYGR